MLHLHAICKINAKCCVSIFSRSNWHSWTSKSFMPAYHAQRQGENPHRAQSSLAYHALWPTLWASSPRPELHRAASFINWARNSSDIATCDMCMLRDIRWAWCFPRTRTSSWTVRETRGSPAVFSWKQSLLATGWARRLPRVAIRARCSSGIDIWARCSRRIVIWARNSLWIIVWTRNSSKAIDWAWCLVKIIMGAAWNSKNVLNLFNHCTLFSEYLLSFPTLYTLESYTCAICNTPTIL